MDLGKPRLRDSHLRERPFPLGKLPKEIIYSICKLITYQIAIGEKDISGSKWEDIFSSAIGGHCLSSPLGLADVVLDDFSWSIKTVKAKNPHKSNRVRIISGRNNVTYSFGINNPLKDIDRTGEAVLSIFNERIKTAKSEYKDLTHSILIRSLGLSHYTYFEKEAIIIDPNNVRWEINKKGNLEGFDVDNKHTYTWQPNGSQFTIIYDVPKDAQMFSLEKPKVLDFNSIMELIEFGAQSVEIIQI